MCVRRLRRTEREKRGTGVEYGEVGSEGAWNVSLPAPAYIGMTPRTVDDAWARVVKALAGKFTMWRNTESLAYTFTQFALYTALP